MRHCGSGVFGGSMGKIIDITSRLKTRNNTVKSKQFDVVSDKVLDLTEARESALSRDRREVKRTILTEFVGAFAILPEKGLMRVAMYDISDNGVAFDIEAAEGRFNRGDEVAMRIYLNHTTYFPFTVTINNARFIEDEGVVRHGAGFLKGALNEVALSHFVKFIETVNVSLKKDDGDVQVSNIS